MLAIVAPKTKESAGFSQERAGASQASLLVRFLGASSFQRWKAFNLSVISKPVTAQRSERVVYPRLSLVFDYDSRMNYLSFLVVDSDCGQLTSMAHAHRLAIGPIEGRTRFDSQVDAMKRAPDVIRS